MVAETTFPGKVACFGSIHNCKADFSTTNIIESRSHCCLLQREPRLGLDGASRFRDLQQGAPLLQRQVQPGPTSDAGGLGRVGNVRATAGRLPRQCRGEPAGHREVGEMYKLRVST